MSSKYHHLCSSTLFSLFSSPFYITCQKVLGPFYGPIFRWKNWPFKLDDIVIATAIHSRQGCLACTCPNCGNHVREWHIQVEIESRDRGDPREPIVHTVCVGYRLLNIMSFSEVPGNSKPGLVCWSMISMSLLNRAALIDQLCHNTVTSPVSG